ncbi:hypothetical protein PbJCM13498_01630 [Prolixibacter bellariivorans]|uniref:DUF1593 domain-containing protein n=1 Tax=Prolixibacter bellariivorans TaxID=314319 RepID=A0A5M4ATP2_9BACT|nr:DUF1593 domain-containing protein [Prolixibacter bellariivorans]GET31300.1 hypothetical protein PbJCM13498_01630 [Prolixibacter bellariivorans]
MKKILILSLLFSVAIGKVTAQYKNTKPRVVVLTDAEIDDQCSMVRFLLYADVFNVEGIITTSSQYHSHGHNWTGDDWMNPYLDAYSQVYSNLKKNDPDYPTPAYLRKRTVLGNVSKEGAMDKNTPGSELIVKLLLNEKDNRPIWFLAWGGTNTLARALKTIQEKYPDKMAYVAKKLRFFFIWEQDDTYQSYIRPNWGKYNILTIICDQFWAIAYQWDKILPADKQKYFKADWMKSHILEGHGPLCSLYQAHKDGDKGGFKAGDFRSEGDSPSFIYAIINGLRDGNMDHPDWGSWGGHYTKVRANTWLDPVPETGYTYPKGRWYTETAWGRQYMKHEYPKNLDLMKEYFKPITRWTDALQNDFAARADWCVKSYSDCNHAPVVKLKNDLNITAKPGTKVQLSAKGSYDPDGNELVYKWWQYKEAETYKGDVEIQNANEPEASFIVPENASKGQTIHIVCSVKDNGSPKLTRYQRVIVTIN